MNKDAIRKHVLNITNEVLDMLGEEEYINYSDFLHEFVDTIQESSNIPSKD